MFGKDLGTIKDSRARSNTPSPVWKGEGRGFEMEADGILKRVDHSEWRATTEGDHPIQGNH